MRRLSLSATLFVAALPLLLAIGAFVTVTALDDLDDVRQAQRGADLGGLWAPLLDVIVAVEAEQGVAEGAGLTDPGANDAARRVTNEAMVVLNTSLDAVENSRPLTLQVGQANATLGLAREAVDAPEMGEARGTTASESYDEAETDLIALGRLLPAEAADVTLGRELTAIAALAEVEQAAGNLIDEVTANVALAATDPAAVDFDRARFESSRLLESVNLFQAIAPEDWLAAFRDARFPRALDDGRRQLTALFAGESPDQLDLDALVEPVAEVAAFRDQLATDTVARAEAAADRIQRDALIRTAVTVAVVALGALLALLVTRSITRRVRRVSTAAHEVTETQLPALVAALSDPAADGAIPPARPIGDTGRDEIAELARSFDTMQQALVDVAHEQVEVLRRGVSDIFVTMARRNRSLVDRQLTLLDELEADVEDPELLADYYRLDHLATRMRRNSESLLVLANAEPKRRRAKHSPIDDVVRAAVGEVEEYQRIEIDRLDPLQVSGESVADVAHVLAELLDNAAAFSSPDTTVAVTGTRSDDGYRLTVADQGIGVPAERLGELNHLLEHPPIVGLSVDVSLGLQVVSLLAAKHGLHVTMREGAPGTVVEVLLPVSVFGPAERRVEPAPIVDRAASRESVEGLAADQPVEAPTVLVGSPGLLLDDHPVAALALDGAALPDVGSPTESPAVEQTVDELLHWAAATSPASPTIPGRDETAGATPSADHHAEPTLPTLGDAPRLAAAPAGPTVPPAAEVPTLDQAGFGGLTRREDTPLRIAAAPVRAIDPSAPRAEDDPHGARTPISPTPITDDNDTIWRVTKGLEAVSPGPVVHDPIGTSPAPTLGLSPSNASPSSLSPSAPLPRRRPAADDELGFSLDEFDVTPSWVRQERPAEAAPAVDTASARVAESAPAVTFGAPPAGLPTAAPLPPPPGLDIGTVPAAPTVPAAEFDRPPAPPTLSTGPRGGPVAPPDAVRGTHPLPATSGPVVTAPSLPTRTRHTGEVPVVPAEDPSVAASRLTPEDLRRRLESFQRRGGGDRPSIPDEPPMDRHEESPAPSLPNLDHWGADR